METLDLVDRLIVTSLSPRMANRPWKGMVRTRGPFNFLRPPSYLWNGWS